MSNKSAILFLREYILEYCAECLWNEIQKPKEQWDLDYLNHYTHLSTYVQQSEIVTVQGILDYMGTIESNDKVIEESRAAFKSFIKNISQEDLNSLLKRMEDAICKEDRT